VSCWLCLKGKYRNMSVFAFALIEESHDWILSHDLMNKKKCFRLRSCFLFCLNKTMSTD
jgi:Pyruvate/2-oxoacid:ferredoxin oxidoreductase delta subunit